MDIVSHDGLSQKAFSKALINLNIDGAIVWRRVYFCKVASGLANQLILSLKALKRVAIDISFVISIFASERENFKYLNPELFYIIQQNILAI